MSRSLRWIHLCLYCLWHSPVAIISNMIFMTSEKHVWVEDRVIDLVWKRISCTVTTQEWLSHATATLFRRSSRLTFYRRYMSNVNLPSKYIFSFKDHVVRKHTTTSLTFLEVSHLRTRHSLAGLVAMQIEICPLSNFCPSKSAQPFNKLSSDAETLKTTEEFCLESFHSCFWSGSFLRAFISTNSHPFLCSTTSDGDLCICRLLIHCSTTLLSARFS